VYRATLVPLVSLALAGCDTTTDEERLEDAQAESTEEVARYCLYGSVPKDRYEGCLRHVDAVDIGRGPIGKWTNAELYAIGLIDECRADAGPACREGFGGAEH
jgi:hypothetical protein